MKTLGSRRLAAVLFLAAMTAAHAAAQAPVPFARFEGLPATPSASPIGFGDVNGDGASDMVVLGAPHVWFNDGHGHFTPAASSSGASGLGTTMMRVADLNGDGRADLIVVTTAGASLWFGGPTGLVAAPAGFQPVVVNARSMVLGDIDGDADLDLLFGILTPGMGLPPFFLAPNAIFLNDGAGSFTAAGALNSPSIGNNSAVLADVDLDGDNDLVAAGIVNPGVAYNTGGVFGGATGFFASTGGTPRGLLAARLNNDAYADFVEFGAGSTIHLRVGGPGGPTPFGTAQPPFSSTTACTVVDLNLDGVDEIVETTPGAVTVLSVAPGGSAFPSAAIARIGGPVYAVNLDGDLDVDVVINVPTPGLNTAYFSDGTGVLHRQSGAYEPRLLYGGPVSLDVNGDGALDLVGTIDEIGVAKLAIAMNDGAGWFSWSTVTPGGGVISPRASLLAAPDLDGDGDRDLVIFELFFLTTSTWTVTPKWLTNTGGVFSATTPGSTFVAGGYLDVAVADVDGDGRDDVILADSTNGVTLFLATPAGGLTLPGTPLHAGAARAIAASDVDVDGDVDFVVGGFPSAILVNGGGVFVADPTLQYQEASYASAGDVTGDGVPEVYLGSNLYMRTGGAWVLFAHIPSGSPFALSGDTRSFDFDHDGDIDTVTGFGRAYVFESPGVVSSHNLPLDVAVGLRNLPVDLDRDGDLDLVSTRPVIPIQSFPTLRPQGVLFNTARQLSVDASARPGRTLHLGIRGIPGGNWLLYASSGLAAIAAPPYGTILIDPATAILVGSGLLDAAGAGSLAIPLPASFSAIVGAEFDVQAAVDTVGGIRLTNARRVVIHGY